MTLIRKGECPPERCQGRCCKHLGIWYSETEDFHAFRPLLEMRGATITHAQDGSYLVDFPLRCQHLTEQNLCALYGQPARPELCSDWPVEPAQLLSEPGCGYSFEEIEEGASIGIN